MAALLAGGARASCWSGAGPSILGMCGPGEAGTVAAEARRSMAADGVAGQVLELKADHRGLVVGEAARDLHRTRVESA